MKRPFTRRLFGGTVRIVRDSYSNKQTDWWTIRGEVFKRDGGKCQASLGGLKCGAPGNEVHHMVPLSRGGTTTKANLITLCKDCHDRRHAGHPKRRK